MLHRRQRGRQLPGHYGNLYRQLRLHGYPNLSAGGAIPELRHQGGWEPSLLHRDG